MTAKRGWAASPARVALEVCEELLSVIRWIRRAGSVSWSSCRRKVMKVAESLQVMRWAITCPVATSTASPPVHYSVGLSAGNREHMDEQGVCTG